VSTRSGGNGSRRPTKAERKEEARLERERIQRQMAARKRNRTLGLVVIAVGVAVVVAVVFITQNGDSSASGIPTPQSLLDQAANDVGTAGCDQVQEEGFYGGVSDTNSPDYQDQAHIGDDKRFPEMPPIDSYPSQPPASGPHAAIPPGPLPAGVYDSPPDLARAIHSLEHGGTIIWYSPDVSGKALDTINRIKEFYGQSDNVGQDRVIVAPYDYDQAGGQLPKGTQMALVAWHKLQTCAQPNLAVAFDFTSQYSFPAAVDREYQGEAPEPGASM
jgi:Protein of unknown function (DUF3105)